MSALRQIKTVDGTRADHDVPVARDWLRVLSKYREPILWRSYTEIAITAVPFVVLWIVAYQVYTVSFWLSLPVSAIAGMFLVRLFLIQHDCGHMAFFRDKRMNDWVGRVIGVVTVTPYEVWRKNHATHHGASGNLDDRGTGDLMTLTVREYHERGLWGRFIYRAYRHPLTLFVIGPIYVYMFENRIPLGYMKQARYWFSAMGTNASMLVVGGAISLYIGIVPFLAIFLPVTLFAAAMGIWLFYVQHQFEETHWDTQDEWQVHEAALHGSSHYVLPQPLKWLSANIGIHHVHHLYSRIPYYRLGEVLKDHPELGEISRLTLRESFSCVKLQLWDESRRRLVTYAEARRGMVTA